MKKTTYSLFLFALLLLTSTISYGQIFRVQSATITNNSIDSCSSTQVDVLTYLGCINWQQGPSTFTINGDTIDVEVNYSSSFICAGAISQPMFNVVLSSLPVKTYQVKASAYIDNTYVNSVYVGLLDVSPCSTTGIETEKSTANFSVFPNPARNFVNIKMGEGLSKVNSKYELLDIKGQLVKSGTIKANSILNQINIDGLTAGLYFMKISNNEISKMKKINVY